MTREMMTRPEFAEFRCPECERTTRFAIGIREGVPSDRPGALDYFPRCQHCGAELRITIFERPRWSPPSLAVLAAVGGMVVLLWTWVTARGSGGR
jgi:uncharacterized protein (DUF983 family)